MVIWRDVQVYTHHVEIAYDPHTHTYIHLYIHANTHIHAYTHAHIQTHIQTHNIHTSHYRADGGLDVSLIGKVVLPNTPTPTPTHKQQQQLQDMHNTPTLMMAMTQTHVLVCTVWHTQYATPRGVCLCIVILSG